MRLLTSIVPYYGLNSAEAPKHPSVQLLIVLVSALSVAVAIGPVLEHRFQFVMPSLSESKTVAQRDGLAVRISYRDIVWPCRRGGGQDKGHVNSLA